MKRLKFLFFLFSITALYSCIKPAGDHRYILGLSFQDSYGNDLVNGIELIYEHSDGYFGEVKPDLYDLRITFPKTNIFGEWHTLFTNWNNNGFLMYDVILYDNSPQIMTINLKCPYIFNNEGIHVINTYWESVNETDDVCYKIEYNGKVIDEIKYGEANSFKSSFAVIVLDDL